MTRDVSSEEIAAQGCRGDFRFAPPNRQVQGCQMVRNRPEKLGLSVNVETLDDVDAAMEEMAWLTAKQRSIEAAAQSKIEAIKTEASEKMVVDVEGKALTIQQRWDALHAALHTWSLSDLKRNLPGNKRSLKLSHGEIKLRAMPAAVQVIEGKKPSDVARDLARNAQMLTAIDELLATEVDGIELSKLIAVEFVIAKDAIKNELEKRPEIREILRSLSIVVEEGKEQITIVPAAVQVATVE